MSDDHLVQCLIRLCRRFDPADPLQGRYAVSKKTGLSEQYLYQVIAGKPMTNGKKRSIGKTAREKISSAYPDWLEQPQEHNNLPAEDRAFVLRIEQEVARYAISDEAKRIILATIQTQPARHSGSTDAITPHPEAKAA